MRTSRTQKRSQPAWTSGASIAIVLALALQPAPAPAKREPGADAVNEQTACEAADLVGASLGLCIAYCEAMDCDADAPRASDRACDRMLANWELHADGRPIPCESIECPCWSSSAELEDIHYTSTQPSYGRPRYRACWSDEDGSVVSVFETVADMSIASRVSPEDASCDTTLRHRGEEPTPIVSGFDLTDDEARECSRVLAGLCP